MPGDRIEPTGRTVRVNGLELHYVDWGNEERPPLVVLHGISSQARYFDGFAVKMREAFHVMSLDQRGHGDSDWSDDYRIEAMADDLLGFADALGLAKFTLIGHSMGGIVSMWFAAHHPERLENLVVVDADFNYARAAGVLFTENSVTAALAQDTFENEEAMLDHYQAMMPGIDVRLVRKPLMYNFRTLEDGRVTYRFDPAVKTALMRRMEEFPSAITDYQAELEAKVGEVTCPVLILRGALSDILLPEPAKETAGAFKDGRLVVVPNATHMIPSDNPTAFRGAIQEFLGV
ncbi:MAG: alpha/beta fold hydrolase [Dehalococcoidia bacterium]